VYELAHKALADDTLSETSRRDITLSLVAAHCNAARDMFQEEKVSMGATLHWNACYSSDSHAWFASVFKASNNQPTSCTAWTAVRSMPRCLVL
jgi:hypothetical protein